MLNLMAECTPGIEAESHHQRLEELFGVGHESDLPEAVVEQLRRYLQRAREVKLGPARIISRIADQEQTDPVACLLAIKWANEWIDMQQEAATDSEKMSFYIYCGTLDLEDEADCEDVLDQEASDRSIPEQALKLLVAWWDEELTLSEDWEERMFGRGLGRIGHRSKLWLDFNTLKLTVTIRSRLQAGMPLSESEASRLRRIRVGLSSRIRRTGTQVADAISQRQYWQMMRREMELLDHMRQDEHENTRELYDDLLVRLAGLYGVERGYLELVTEVLSRYIPMNALQIALAWGINLGLISLTEMSPRLQRLLGDHSTGIFIGEMGAFLVMLLTKLYTDLRLIENEQSNIDPIESLIVAPYLLRKRGEHEPKLIVVIGGSAAASWNYLVMNLLPIMFNRSAEVLFENPTSLVGLSSGMLAHVSVAAVFNLLRLVRLDRTIQQDDESAQTDNI